MYFMVSKKLPSQNLKTNYAQRKKSRDQQFTSSKNQYYKCKEKDFHKNTGLFAQTHPWLVILKLNKFSKYSSTKMQKEKKVTYLGRLKSSAQVLASRQGLP